MRKRLGIQTMQASCKVARNFFGLLPNAEWNTLSRALWIFTWNILKLNKALPFLEQLDRSMKYERRSVLDKSELLVDVKLPNTSDQDADLEEDEYLRAFQLDDLDKMKEKQRRAYENLEDDDDDQDEDEEGHDEEDEELEEDEDEEEQVEEEHVESSQGINLYGRNIRNINLKENHHQMSIKLKHDLFNQEQHDNDK